MKVEKHLHANPSKAAAYFAALTFRDGGQRPAEGTAEFEVLVELKERGFRFKRSPDGDVVCETPEGRFYSGRSVLAQWNELTA